MTLVFPDSLSNTFPRTAPLAEEVFRPDNTSAEVLPSTWNPLSPISQDTALAFSVPFSEASDFLSSIQELPNKAALTGDIKVEDQVSQAANSWIMKAAKSERRHARGSLSDSASNAWTGFVDLLKVH